MSTPCQTNCLQAGVVDDQLSVDEPGDDIHDHTSLDGTEDGQHSLEIGISPAGKPHFKKKGKVGRARTHMRTQKYPHWIIVCESCKSPLAEEEQSGQRKCPEVLHTSSWLGPCVCSQPRVWF